MSLTEIIEPIWKRWAKIDNREQTFCNLFVNGVMVALDYHAFEGKTANGILSIIEFERFTWDKIDPLTDDWKDCVVVAGLHDSPHGHVNILLPGDFVESGKWKKKVPICANIGQDNTWGKGVNWSFRTEPNYYRFKKQNIV